MNIYTNLSRLIWKPYRHYIYLYEKNLLQNFNSNLFAIVLRVLCKCTHFDHEVSKICLLWDFKSLKIHKKSQAWPRSTVTFFKTHRKRIQLRNKYMSLSFQKKKKPKETIKNNCNRKTKKKFEIFFFFFFSFSLNFFTIFAAFLKVIKIPLP